MKKILSLIDNLNEKHDSSCEFDLKLDILKNYVKKKDIEIYFNILLFPDNAKGNRYHEYYLREIFSNTIYYYRELVYFYPKINLEIEEVRSHSITQKGNNLEYLYKLTGKSYEEIDDDIHLLAKRYDGISNASESDREENANDIESFLLDYLKEYNKKIENMIDTILPKSERPSNNTIEYTNEEKKKVIQDSFNSYLPITGQNFRLFYRIIKYLNENKKLIGEDQWQNYLGFLKAQFDEKILCLIFYDAAFTEIGEKMGFELKKTHFFGDDNDFDGQQHSYFSKGTLLWSTDTLDLRSITNLKNN